MFTAIVYVLISGCAWRHLPTEFGVSSSTAHRRFAFWAEQGFGRGCTRSCWMSSARWGCRLEQLRSWMPPPSALKRGASLTGPNSVAMLRPPDPSVAADGAGRRGNCSLWPRWMASQIVDLPALFAPSSTRIPATQHHQSRGTSNVTEPGTPHRHCVRRCGCGRGGWLCVVPACLRVRPGQR
ncbi:transposase [Actinomadura barringtoniae]|uniref:Transposase n=1 Tax=Actinomadura barringtoniae TaxID=1427535 RepID=A0A939T7N2_9ACTN|nr:transposase [Actinomadura barringtoniae]